ncbi:hypothetical protein LZ30DRAFT_100080 [Colletotrichum cereale]|nr:hypothetical protein LZ30DRAFT_100080 [Colletotrichum cereale]
MCWSRGIARKLSSGLCTKATDSIRELSKLKEKCDRVHKKATSSTRVPASKSEWHDLIAPYQALLIATKSGPISANEQVQCQAVLGVWECVQSFLEHLLELLPTSREGTLPLITTAQCCMDFLLEHLPCLKGFGLHCLGDLAKYRMEVEIEPTSRKRWQEASKRWHEEAIKKTDGWLTDFGDRQRTNM